MEDNELKEWIKRVISSCANTVHFDYAKVLVELYKGKTDIEADITEVEDHLAQAYNAVHGIIVKSI